jgi:MYXO-CTERM domain-containing protein
VTTVGTLYWRGAISTDDAMTAAPDLLLGILFVVAFAATRRRG